MNLVNRIIEKLPDRKSIIGVYAVIVFLGYSWSLVVSFYKIPSWMLYLDLLQIASIYAYLFVFGLIESIFSLLIVVLLGFAFTLNKKNDTIFQSRAILIYFVLFITSAARLIAFQDYEQMAGFTDGEFAWWLGAFLIGVPLVVFGPKSYWLNKLIHGFADRASIFLFVYPPLSLISVLIVILRNVNLVI